MTGKASSSCPVLRAILDRNGEGPLPQPPQIKPPPTKASVPRYSEAETQAMTRASEKQALAKLVGYAPSRNDILQHANQALQQAKARQSRQPLLIKGSPAHKKSLLKTQPPTKPPPGFPPGTAVPKGFDVISAGRMLYQPALLPTNMLLAQSEALQLALESLPKTASAQPVIASNGQSAMIRDGVHPAQSSRDQDARFARQKMSRIDPYKYAGLSIHRQVKCGKRFCFNKHKRCGSRVTYNIKPPSRSGLKDFS
eukprot:4872067-Amphidinium_carterae.2